MSDYTIVFDSSGFPIRINHYAELPELSDREVNCTGAQASQFKQYIFLNGELKYVGIAPSLAHDLDMNSGEWVLNPEKKALLDEQAYKASVPEAVTMVQAKLALLEFGFLDLIEDHMQSDLSSREAKIFWSGTTVRRDDKIVNQMLQMLGLNDKQGDALFMLAKTKRG